MGGERHTGDRPAELTAAGPPATGLSGNELSGAGLSPSELTAGLRASYDVAADDWAEGPGPVYDRLAAALVAAAPVPVVGRLVLDLGAGAGVAGRAALAAGARRVVGADLSEAMLRRGRGGSPVVAPRWHCRSAIAASTWWWRHSASTIWSASRPAWPRHAGSGRRSPRACAARILSYVV